MTISKNLTDRLNPPRHIDYQRILQSNWTRGTAGHTKVVVSNAAFP